MNDINVRTAYPDDAQILSYIMKKSWRKAFSHIIAPDMMKKCGQIENERAQMLYRVLADKSHDAVLCEKDGSPCGMIVYKNRPSDVCEIVAVHSVPDSWGTGCGRAMMDAVIERIKKKNCSYAFLWVFCKNRRARSFYEKCGFVPDGAEKNSAYDAREMRYIREII